MKIGFLRLRPRLSAINWMAIELFLLLGLFSLPFSKSMADIFTGLSLFLWAVRKFPFKETLPDVPIAGKAWGLFFIFLVLSLFQAPAHLRFESFRGIIEWVQYLGLGFMGVDYFRNENRSKRLFYCFLLMTVGICLNGLYQLTVGVDMVKRYSVDIPSRLPRMRSSLASPNMLAAFLLIGIPVSFYFWQNTGKKIVARTLFCLIFILVGTSFLLTLSRAAFVGLYLAALAYLFLRRQKVLFAVALLSPLAFLFSKTLGGNFITSLIDPKDITVGERFIYWSAAWKMIAAHPVFGVGAGLFTYFVAEFEPALAGFKGHAHNCYLELWGEAGFGALIAFVTPVFFLLWKMGGEFWTKKFKAGLRDALWVGLSAFLIQSAFDTNLFSLQTALLFWIFWGYLMAESAKKAPALPMAAAAATSNGK